MFGGHRVDDGERGVAALHLPKEVGPDLGFGYDHERWVQPPQHVADGEHQIHRRVEDPVGQFPQLALRRGLPGYGARGNEQPGPWELGAEAAEEVGRTQDLAHRNRMEPDGAGTGLTK